MGHRGKERSGHNPAGAQFEEGGFAGADVGEGVMGMIEGFLEQLAMEFGEIGIFEVAVASGDRAEGGGFFHGATQPFF